MFGLSLTTVEQFLRQKLNLPSESVLDMCRNGSAHVAHDPLDVGRCTENGPVNRSRPTRRCTEP